MDVHEREDDTVVFRATGITKSFVSVRALDDVHLTVRRGEVHALLGQNGAGKSTLVRIIAGATHPDAGALTIDGQVLSSGDPDVAMAHRIGYVSQEGNLNPGFTVPENVFLGREPTRLGLLDRAAMRRETARLLDEFGLLLDLDTPAERLDPAKRKLTEIVRALALRPKLLILDEPTAALPQPDVEHLLAMIRHLATSGIGILFISHYLAEVFAVAHTVTVLRDGARVFNGPVSTVDADALVRHMIGRRVELIDKPRAEPGDAEPLLRIEGLATADGRVVDAGMTATPGRIRGIFGVVGAGKSELLEAAFGLRAPAAGNIVVDGRPMRRWHPSRAIATGMALVPEDRLEKALLADQSIAWNVAMPYWRALGRGLSIGRNEAQLGDDVMRELAIRAPRSATLVAALSGGNKQKVSIGRWLGAHATARIFLFDEPTQGLDVGARTEVYRLMRRLAANGAAIVVASSDLDEILAISDDITVIRGGTTTDLDNAASREPAAILGAAT